MSFRKILLIDDDKDDQEIFKSALTEVSEQLSCEVVSDARQALEKLTSRQLNPDVIFLDLNMPVMNGHEFLKEVKKSETSAHIPVIIFSTTSNPATVKRTKEMGAMNFITKPDRFDSLVNILRPILN